MSAASDLLYGRQGGRIVTKRGSSTHLDHAPRCELCDQPMVLGQRRTHLVCTEATGQQHPQGTYPEHTHLRKTTP